MPPAAPPILGLIAGSGRLPVATARGMRAAGCRVVCVGLRDQFVPELPALCDEFAVAGITRLGRWIRLLKRWGAHQAIMVGKVQKTRMYDPWRLFRDLPDWRAARLWYVKLRHDKRSDHLLSAVADELAASGVELIDSTTYIPQFLAGSGVLTRRAPSAEQRADIDFALPILRRMGELDIGQALAVKEREVIAVEAIEGTDAMIHRAGELCRTGGWVLLKAAKPQQDMRFDVPTLGAPTIAALKEARASCVAVETGRVILLDKPQLLAAADAAGICVVGVELGRSQK